jgi:hypothetical protein
MNRLRNLWLEIRIWWIEAHIESCTDAATRARLGAELCRLIGRKWDGA